MYGDAAMKDAVLKLFAVTTILAVPSCIYLVETSPRTIERRRLEAAKVEEDKLPRKVNEANGCEVWAFKPGDRWLYFTRCAARTETVNSWDVCRSVQQGKTTRTECTPHSLRITQELN